MGPGSHLRTITAMMHVSTAAAAFVAACVVMVLQGCGGGGETPAPGPMYPEYTCTSPCVIVSECESHGDHDHVHYSQTDCVMEPADPSGSCADFAAAWAAMDANQRMCQKPACAAKRATIRTSRGVQRQA